MKVLIICNNNLFLFPFLKKYLDVFNDNCDYKVLYWNRNNNKEITIDIKKTICFNYTMNTYKSRLFKLKGYYKYKKFIIDHIKRNKYDFVIVFNTQTALMINKVLKKNKYIFDYRDESFEKYNIYRKKVEKIINNSRYTIMSSFGFKKLFKNLNDSKVLIMHNNKFNTLKKVQNNIDGKITISFWGMVRYVEYYKRILDLFGNNSEYIVNIYGEGYTKALNIYSKSKKYKNINFFGKYDDTEIEYFARNTDILLNCYPIDSIQKYSLTCKLYEGIVFGIPMIIEKDSYMDEFLINNNYPHFQLDFTKSNNEILINLKKWFKDNKNILKNSENILRIINTDNEETLDKIKKCFEK